MPLTQQQLSPCGHGMPVDDVIINTTNEYTDSDVYVPFLR